MSWFLQHSLKGRAACIRENGWKYSFHTDDKEELYNLDTDPFEVHNLANHPAHQTQKETLKNKLISWLLNEAAQ